MKIFTGIVLAVTLVLLPNLNYCSQHDSINFQVAREEWGPIPTMVDEHESSLLQDLTTLIDQLRNLGKLHIHEKEYCWEDNLLERCEDFWMSFDNVR